MTAENAAEHTKFEVNRYLPHLGGDFSNLVIFHHTDLLRGGNYQYRLNQHPDSGFTLSHSGHDVG